MSVVFAIKLQLSKISVNTSKGHSYFEEFTLLILIKHTCIPTSIKYPILWTIFYTYGHFLIQYILYGHFIPYRHFPIQYVLYGHIISYGHFSRWTLFYMDILPYGQFADSPQLPSLNKIITECIKMWSSHGAFPFFTTNCLSLKGGKVKECLQLRSRLPIHRNVKIFELLGWL